MRRSSNHIPAILASLFISVNYSGTWSGSAVYAAGDIDTQLTQIVRNAGILSPDIARSAVAAHRATSNGFTVTVSTYRNSKASDNDCKIDAVLLAKKIRDKFPSQVQDIMVVFYDVSRTAYRSVTVRPGDLDVFSSGAISKEKFLQMLTVVRNEMTVSQKSNSIADQVMNYHVVDGAYKIQRQQLLLSLQDMLQYHGDVSSLWGPYLNLEKLIQAGQIDEFALQQAKLAKLVNEANSRVHDQFNAELNEARQEAREERTARISEDAARFAAAGQVRSGPEYLRRERLAQVIRQRQKEGINVNIYAQILYGEIETKAQTNDPGLDRDIGQLEAALELPPLK